MKRIQIIILSIIFSAVNFSLYAEPQVKCYCPSVEGTKFKSVISKPNGSASATGYEVICRYENGTALRNPVMKVLLSTFTLSSRRGNWHRSHTGQYVCVDKDCPFSQVNTCPATDDYKPYTE